MLFTPDQGYRVRLTSTLSLEEPRHRFCGPHTLPGASCPNCRRPLQALVTLDTDDPRLGLPRAVLGLSLPLLWCWACPVAQAPFTYSVRAGTVALISYRKGRRTADFPYPDYPDHLPSSSVRLLPISPRTAHLIQALNEGADAIPWRFRQASTPCHQVGGVPYLLQGSDYQEGYEALQCPACKHPMALLASIGNRCLDPRGICGNAYVQVLFHICPDHATITAIQQCD